MAVGAQGELPHLQPYSSHLLISPLLVILLALLVSLMLLKPGKYTLTGMFDCAVSSNKRFLLTDNSTGL